MMINFIGTGEVRDCSPFLANRLSSASRSVSKPGSKTQRKATFRSSACHSGSMLSASSVMIDLIWA